MLKNIARENEIKKKRFRQNLVIHKRSLHVQWIRPGEHTTNICWRSIVTSVVLVLRTRALSSRDTSPHVPIEIVNVQNNLQINRVLITTLCCDRQHYRGRCCLNRVMFVVIIFIIITYLPLFYFCRGKY